MFPKTQNFKYDYMNTFKQSAIEVLEKAGTPLHYIKITKLALESGILETEGATPERTMNSYITSDIKHKGQGSDFIKTTPGTFALNPNKKEIEQTPKIIEAEKEEEDRKKAELIYNNYKLISEILSEINKAKEKHSWEEIKKRLKGHKIVKDIDMKEKKVTVEVS